mmetsp:Transcript_110620/g.308159  ORF Transcript_110620/g.308159 Transcript_110620/m.308159 type:complete len:273 (-) Transcript_110620:2929-3747(-)
MGTFCSISMFQPRFRMIRCTTEMSSPSASAILSASRPRSARRSMLRWPLSPTGPGSTFGASAQRLAPQADPKLMRRSTSPGLPTSGGSRPPETSQTRTATAPPLWSLGCRDVLLGLAVRPLPPGLLPSRIPNGHAGARGLLGLLAGLAAAPPQPSAHSHALPPSSPWSSRRTAGGRCASTLCKSATRSNISAFKWSCPYASSEAAITSTQMPSSLVATISDTESLLTLPISLLRPVKSTSNTPALMCCRSSYTRKSNSSFQTGSVVWVMVVV